MADAAETPVAPGGPPPAGVEARLPASTWVGLAVVGTVLFVLGIWLPAWRGVPGGVGLNYVAAAAGAVLLVVGLTFASRVRARARPDPIEELPGVEVFRPATKRRVVEATESDEDRA
jgi:hypothetical protein